MTFAISTTVGKLFLTCQLTTTKLRLIERVTFKNLGIYLKKLKVDKIGKVSKFRARSGPDSPPPRSVSFFSKSRSTLRVLVGVIGGTDETDICFA